MTRYPEFTWNEFYLEVSRLNRNGLVKITRGVGIFTIKQTAAIHKSREMIMCQHARQRMALATSSPFLPTGVY